jgi:hypothetical protein
MFRSDTGSQGADASPLAVITPPPAQTAHAGQLERRMRVVGALAGVAGPVLHLGDRAASDRYLAIASADPLRRYWVFDAQVRQRKVMRHLLDGRWSDASAEITETRVRAARDPNILLGCDAQESWLRRETGAAEH